MYLQKALDNVRAGRLCIPIYAATGSINKEVEKQNKMLMLQHVNMHYQQIQGILAAAANPMTPPDVVEYGWKVADSSQRLLSGLLRDFGETDPSQILPAVDGQQKIEQKKQQQQGAQQPPPQGAQPPQSLLPGATPDNVRSIASGQ